MIFASLYLNQFIYNMAIIPLVISIVTGCNLVAAANSNAYPGILIGNVICSLIIIIIGYCMYLTLLNLNQEGNE